MLANATQSDGGLTVSWLIKAGLVILAVLVVVSIVVGISIVFWRFAIWIFFGGKKRGLLSIAGLSAGLYLDVVNPVDLFWQIDAAWAEYPVVAVVGMVVLAGPVYLFFLLWTGESLSSVTGRPSMGGWGHSSGGPTWSQPPASQARAEGWPAPNEPPSGFDSRYGPQQGTSSLADQPGSLYGDGPQQGFKTLADEPGGLYSDGPEY